MAQQDHPYRRQSGEPYEPGRRHNGEFDFDDDERSPRGPHRRNFERQYGQSGQQRSGPYDNEWQRGAYGMGSQDGPGLSGREEADQRSWQQGAFGSQAGRRAGEGHYGDRPDSGRHNPGGYYGQGDTGQRRFGRDDDDGGRPHNEPFDPDYHQWRNEQMRSLDDDYRKWRQDRYKKFSDEFSTWRNSRQAQGGQSGSSAGGNDDTSRTGSGSGSGNKSK